MSEMNMKLWKSIEFLPAGDSTFDFDTNALGAAALMKDMMTKSSGHLSTFAKSGKVKQSASSEDDVPMSISDKYAKFMTELGGRLLYKDLSSNGNSALFIWENGMVSVDISGIYTSVYAISQDEILVKKIRDYFATQWAPAETTGHIYAIVSSNGRLSMSSIGNAGIALEAGNYTPKVMEDYKFMVKDLCSETPSGRIAIMRGVAGCHQKGTKLLMFDGSTKNVENIIVGDRLMGPDSTPRNVLSLCRGREEMVRINPKKGKSWTVNKNHILTLVRSGYDGGLVDMKVSDWISLPEVKRRYFKLIRAGVSFNCVDELPIDPYVVGILIGDGCLTQRTPKVATTDHEVVKALRVEAKKFGLSVHRTQYNGKCPTYSICFDDGGKKRKNPFALLCEDLSLNIKCGQKHIPGIYKTSSVENRLQLLGGLLDSDGHLDSKNACFDYISKSLKLAQDVEFLARSLGFAAYIKKCKKSSQNGTVGIYYRMNISGDISTIPTRIKRKLADKRKKFKNVLLTGFTTEPCPVDDYYGFSLDCDQRYLLDDFTITHNTGKTHLIRAMLLEVPDALFVLVSPDLATNLPGPELLPLLMQYHANISGPIVLVIEDADKCLVSRDEGNMNSVQSLLNLGDGILGSLLDIRIVATTNADEFKMDAAITRPGRLSKMLDVGVLDYETARGVFKRLLPEAALPKELALEYDATQIEPHPSHSGLHYMGARAALMKEADKRMADFKMTLAEVYALARTNGWTAAPRKAENPEPEDDVEDESLWY